MIFTYLKDLEVKLIMSLCTDQNLFQDQGNDINNYYINRPKVSNILPTPMLLCEHSTNDPNEERIFSINNNIEEDTIKWTKDDEQFNINEEVSSLYNDIRKELAEIRLSNSYKDYCKDYEPMLNIENRLNERQYFRYSGRKIQRKSIWKKYIEIEDMNYQQSPQLRYSMKNSHYSLLRILEGAANESMKRRIQVI